MAVDDEAGHRELTGVPMSPGVAVGRAVRAGTPSGSGGRVVIASGLTPADVAAFDADSVVAVATVAGAPLSHAAILVRSMGIPAVTGLDPSVLHVPDATPVLVDGDAGTVVVQPTPDQVDRARALAAVAGGRREEIRHAATAPAVTRDGVAVPVVVNVGGPEEARRAVAEGADGAGMVRTEFIFLGRPAPPDEDEQYLAYRSVAEAFGDRPVVVRTLDLGSDIPAWGAAPEPNPALGLRGIRVALARGGLLDTQLRAIVRLASERTIGVMFPMVTTVDELRAARARLDAVTMRSMAGKLDVGITVEVPAAALTASSFAPLVDFLIVGTNDLTQYTLAADRANADVAALADGLHPGVLRMIREVTSAAATAGLRRPVCVVGELACDPLAVPVLLGLGVGALSVRANAVGAVKQFVRGVAMEEARALAEKALSAESAAAVRKLAAGLAG